METRSRKRAEATSSAPSSSASPSSGPTTRSNKRARLSSTSNAVVPPPIPTRSRLTRSQDSSTPPMDSTNESSCSGNDEDDANDDSEEGGNGGGGVGKKQAIVFPIVFEGCSDDHVHEMGESRIAELKGSSSMKKKRFGFPAYSVGLSSDWRIMCTAGRAIFISSATVWDQICRSYEFYGGFEQQI